MTKADHQKHHVRKPYSLFFSSWHGKWRLFVWKDDKKVNGGIYKTKEEALKIIQEKYGLKVML